MTIEEAINHCYDKASESLFDGCIACAKEHAQLAIWLEELVEYRNKEDKERELNIKHYELSKKLEEMYK